MRQAKQFRGFTLIELLVVVLIIGILAAVAVPQYFKVVEKGRIAEVTAYIGDLRSSQERFCIRNGGYTSNPNALDVSIPNLKYFSNVPTVANGNMTSGWAVTFVRSNGVSVPAGYASSYQVIFNSVTGNYSSNDSNVVRDLLPQ